MDNADLEKLRVSPGKLSPKFKASITDYTLTVGSSISEIKLTVLTSDSGASYCIKGTDGGGKVAKMEQGQLLDVEIIVSAEDGTTTKTYTIKMRRLSAEDATLSDLDVSAGFLSPTFDPLEYVYKCCLPCSVDTLSLTTKTEEDAMKVSMGDGSPIGILQLNPGRTLTTIAVKSASGKNTTEYTIIFEKSDLPPTLRLQKKKAEFECAVCCCLVNKATRIQKESYVYCQDCLEELTRTNKMDPFTGRKLEEEEWMVMDFECDAKLGMLQGACPLPSGPVEAPVNQMGSKFMEAGKKIADMPTEGCKECSKKIPHPDLALHKELLCTAKHPVQLETHAVKAKVWEKRLDECIGSSASTLVNKALEWEGKYLRSLPHPGENVRYEANAAPLDHLMRAAQAYASAINLSPKEGHNHLALGLVLEELFYAKDLFGQAQDEPMDGAGEGEAENSSREEEFLAICKLHGVLPSAPVALQLKAVDSEYQSLKEAGQTHKADHVQGLYAWKSKKILEADQGSYAVEKESPLFKAKLKYQDAISINPSDSEACYHLGRISLLLGDKDTARKYLMAAVALKPTLAPARFCLGLVLPEASSTHAKTLLLHGLTKYLADLRVLYEVNPEPYKEKLKELHANKFFRRTNTLIIDGFLHLASLSGHGHLTVKSCLLSVTSCVSKAHLHHRGSTYERLHWSSLKARSVLLHLLHKEGDPAASRHCKQLSALISSSGLESTPAVREMQMEVFQLGVELQPSSSEALYHLGNWQLNQYDASNEARWLKDAELSFRASMEMEGKAILRTVIPEQLKEQDWWKNKEAKAKASSSASSSSSAASKGPSSGPVGKKPVTTTSGPRAQPSKQQPGNRQAPPGRQQQQQPKPAATATTRMQAAGGGRGVATGGGRGGVTAGGRGAATGGGRGAATGGGRGAATTGASRVGGAGAKKPSVDVAGAGGRGAGKPGPVQKPSGNTRTAPATGKTVATLGDLKAGTNASKGGTSAGANTSKGSTNASTSAGTSISTGAAEQKATSVTVSSSTSSSSANSGDPEDTKKEVPVEKNRPSYQARLGLARTLAKIEKEEEAKKLYKEVMKMSPTLHDAYIELGEMLHCEDPKGAVEVYAKFPFQDPPTFDDAFLHGEIIRLVMRSEDYDNPYLASSMIAMGKALGIGVLEKQVAILENKFKSALLKSVYAGVHGKPVDDPELQAFFKFKCWL